MATFASSLSSSAHVRPFRAWRDYAAVSQLLRICFSDGEENSVVASDSVLRTAWDRAEHWLQFPLAPGGFVWEEQGRIVGNASLLYLRYRGRLLALIANVAVHPQFRGRGIARSLMERVLEQAKEQRVGEIWLQVRADNPIALSLYQKLGFIARARRTTWYATTTPEAPEAEAVHIYPLPRSLWPLTRRWLERLHPQELGWYHQWDWEQARPGWEMSLWRWLLGVSARGWVAWSQNRPQAMLLWYPSPRAENGLWAAWGTETSVVAIQALLEHARRLFYATRRTLYLEHPTGEAESALRAAGFHPIRTLVWMRWEEKRLNGEPQTAYPEQRSSVTSRL